MLLLSIIDDRAKPQGSRTEYFLLYDETCTEDGGQAR
jgi:hypothetical protein